MTWRRLLGFSLLLLVTLLVLALPLAVLAETSRPTGLYLPLQRFGVGVANKFGTISNYNVAPLRVGWYSDWATNAAPSTPGGIEYVQLVKVRDSEYPTSTLVITTVAQARPGSLWLVGNEPEGRYNQGNRTPQEYAQIYHDTYTLIKRVDPTAKVAIGGVILPSPLRRQWLDMVLNEYQSRFGEPMPVDVWNVHGQILNEDTDPGRSWGASVPVGLTATHGITLETYHNADASLFIQLVTEFRAWMAARGERNKPLIISEFGVLMPSTYLCPPSEEECTQEMGDERVKQYMTQTFDFLLSARDSNTGYPADDNRLVQRWLWYALNTPPYELDPVDGFNGALFDYNDPHYPGTLTVFGEHWIEYVSTLSRRIIYLPLVLKRFP